MQRVTGMEKATHAADLAYSEKPVIISGVNPFKRKKISINPKIE